MATIAVLPFADMSPGRDHGYLCEGLAEELINALTQVDGLRVAARTASFRFRDLGADVKSVGHQLGVSALLEGSVCKASAPSPRLAVHPPDARVYGGIHFRFDQDAAEKLGTEVARYNLHHVLQRVRGHDCADDDRRPHARRRR